MMSDVFRREADLPVEAIYAIKRTTEDGFTDWNIVVVVSPFRPGMDSDFISKLVELRRAGKLPSVDERVRIEAVPPDHDEASRLLDYARQVGHSPLVIRDVIWQGLSIEYALLAEDFGAQARAA